MTSLNCGVDVLRAVEPDSTGQHAQTYNTEDDCIAARDRLIAKAERDTTRPLTPALRGVPSRGRAKPRYSAAIILCAPDLLEK